ncbi:Cytochrome C oxidase subunit IV family protein [Sulfidibacter corallicola]|uniref:Cytochrome C oxidase subunit IV family protein n=1 Tax=Sulfidibacter corallicola TaxID=2818388 RepID=A0A8A4TFF4_SULCO|nr:cytochrome C oxidase subunit IV family protein [Sulfidibacter corallicola]QTD47932.1 cytochrome C oxidase subunit IV family protein [Sulfidibacter corallicola]
MAHHDHHEEGHMGHIQSKKVYHGVILALVVLTAVTVAAAQLDLGALGNDLLAVAIATVKASLVITFFMHGKYEDKVTWAFIWYPIILLATLLAALFIDYGNRDWDLFKYRAASVTEQHHGDGHGTTPGQVEPTAQGTETHGEEADHGAPAHKGDGAHGEEAGQGDETKQDDGQPADGDDHGQNDGGHE